MLFVRFRFARPQGWIVQLDRSAIVALRLDLNTRPTGNKAVWLSTNGTASGQLDSGSRVAGSEGMYVKRECCLQTSELELVLQRKIAE